MLQTEKKNCRAEQEYWHYIIKYASNFLTVLKKLHNVVKSTLRIICDPHNVIWQGFIIIIIGIQPLGRSVDWYGSGTLHPGQVLRGSLPLLSPAF